VVDEAGSSEIPADRRLAGILLMCAAVACFACLDASAKWLNRSVDPLLTTWARYVSSVVLISLLVNPVTVPGLMRTTRPGLQALRSLLLLLSTLLNFFALSYLQLTQALSIQFAAPLLIALLAGPLLGEWPGPRRLAAVAVGFSGVLVVARPGFGGLHPAAFLSVLGSVAYALYAITTRMLAAHDRSYTTLFYSGAAGVMLLAPVIPFVWSTPQSALVWIMLVAVGAIGSLGHWFLILAHARAPAPVLSPFIYTEIIWMTALGYVVFGDVPDGWTMAGAAIVVASGLYLLSRERSRRRGG
jgi:drug/metabolite transporter (DMT)-like permease